MKTRITFLLGIILLLAFSGCSKSMNQEEGHIFAMSSWSEQGLPLFRSPETYEIWQTDDNTNIAKPLVQSQAGTAILSFAFDDDVLSFAEARITYKGANGSVRLYPNFKRQILDLKTKQTTSISEFDFSKEATLLNSKDYDVETLKLSNYISTIMTPFFKRGETIFYLEPDSNLSQILNAIETRFQWNKNYPLSVTLYKQRIGLTEQKEKLATLPITWFANDNGFPTIPRIIISRDGRYAILPNVRTGTGQNSFTGGRFPMIMVADSNVIDILETSTNKLQEIELPGFQCNIYPETLQESFLAICNERGMTDIRLIEIPFENPDNQKLLLQNMASEHTVLSPDSKFLVILNSSSLPDVTVYPEAHLKDIIIFDLKAKETSRPVISNQFEKLTLLGTYFLNNSSLLVLLSDPTQLKRTFVILDFKTGLMSDFTPYMIDGIKHMPNYGINIVNIVPKTGEIFYALFESEGSMTTTLYAINSDGSERHKIENMNRNTIIKHFKIND